MVVKVTMFLITTTVAKHHHSNLGTNADFFDGVYVAIHSVFNDLFKSIDIGTNFSNQSSTKLLLTMHHDLKNIANVAIDTYNVIQEIINDKNSNQTYFTYSLNDTEEDVMKLNTIVNEILNKKNFDVYRAIKGTKRKHEKDPTVDFVIRFLAKANNLTIHDLKKSAKYGSHEISSKKNLREWSKLNLRSTTACNNNILW